MSEQRDLTFESAEFRFADDEKRTLEGYASMYGVSYDLGRFDEVVEAGHYAMPGEFHSAAVSRL